jgi:hypothetical protein
MTVKMSHCTGWVVFAAVAAVVPSAMVSGREAQGIASAALCWRSLAPETGPQDVALAFTEPTLAATRTGEIWLGWQENDTRLFRRAAGQWTLPQTPMRAGVDSMWVETIVASPSGRIVIAAAANRDDGASELHIARMDRRSVAMARSPAHLVGGPFTHAQRASIAFIGERPVVASEERSAKLAGLFVALWDGSSWTRLGSVTPASDDPFLSPAVAVDANRQVWLAWNESGGGIRVARWDGSSWLDIGRDTLEQITTTQGPTALRAISLEIDTKGHAWVLRLAAEEPSAAGLALARWDGVGWTAVPAPRGPEGKDSTVWSASMILRNDAPIVAWSQSDATDNRRLYVSESVGDRWTARLSGLHLVEGVSNVRDVRLAAGDQQTLFVSWDEPGKDGRRTRLLQADVCAAGETPAASPKSVVERDTWPTTVDEAARRIVGALDNESKAHVRTTKKDQLIQYHHSWGMGIRNSLGLWRGNEKLLESCGQGRRIHPDDCSTVIIEAVWTLLQTPEPATPAR